MIRAEDFEFFLQQRERWFVEARGQDGIVTGKANVGVPMGDKAAPKEFLKPFREAITKWQLKKPAMQPTLFMRCPDLSADIVLDSSITTFADDVWRKFILSSGTMEQAKTTVKASNKVLEPELAWIKTSTTWWWSPSSVV